MKITIVKLISFLVVFFYSTKALSEPCPTTLVAKGAPAPCAGFMLSPEAAEVDAKLPQQIKLLEEKLTLQDQRMSLKDSETLLYQTAHNNDVKTIATLSSALNDRDKSEVMKIGLAAGGTAIAVSILAICLAFAFGGASKSAK